jgi:hypothetical protein
MEDIENNDTKRALIFKLLISICFTFPVQGCHILDRPTSTIPNAINPAASQIENAITKLSEQSADWQGTLRELEDKLKRDGESAIANEVTQLAQKGIATGGTELRCNTDFIRMRMSQDLQRIVARLTGKPIPPLIPALCQVVPDHVDMGHRPNQITYYGYDLNPNINIVLKHDGGEESLNQFKAHPTHYLMALDLTASSLCGKSNRKIVLRNGSEDINSVNVIRKVCPTAEPRPSRDAEKDHIAPIDHYESCGPFCGISTNIVFGGTCEPGYERSRYIVSKISGAGWCSGDGSFKDVQLGWVDPGNPNNCGVRVHFGAGWGQDINCRIEIKEIGMEKPIPITPDCGCW